MIPELLDIGEERHVLPPGRYNVPIESIQERYAPEHNDVRKEIWVCFQQLVSLVKESIGEVALLWIGGSFVSSKSEPKDIDVVFVVKEDVYGSAVLTKEGNYALASLSRRIPQISDKVDAFLMVVPNTIGDQAAEGYCKTRGYWDHLWSKPRRADANREHPEYGYLEVTIDGF